MKFQRIQNNIKVITRLSLNTIIQLPTYKARHLVGRNADNWLFWTELTFAHKQCAQWEFVEDSVFKIVTTLLNQHVSQLAQRALTSCCAGSQHHDKSEKCLRMYLPWAESTQRGSFKAWLMHRISWKGIEIWQQCGNVTTWETAASERP